MIKKTAMELALARIEMLYGKKPDDIHWEMFKNDCMEKEKEQIIKSVNSNEKYCVEFCNGIYKVMYPAGGKLCSVDKKAGLNYYTKTYNK
jgi:hypothetical protein